MRMQQIGGLPILHFESLADDGIQQHAVFTRQGGVSQGHLASLNMSSAVGDDPRHLAENRRRGFGAFGRSLNTLVHAHLVHSNHVARVTRAEHGSAIKGCDALITNDPGCGLAMNFADCAPIFLYDPVKRAIGLGHAGWKGTLHDVPGAMVRAMVREFGSDPATLRGAIGPCIHVDSYEVDEPVTSGVRTAFPNAHEDLLPYPNGPARRPHFDLPQANRLNFLRAGVTQIEVVPLNTAARTDLFFSHRYEQGRTGRFGTIFLLKENGR